MKKLFIFAVLCFFCVGNADAKLFDGTEFYLDNGLRVIVIPNHRAPIVKHMVWYKIGSMDDELGASGTAHLLEHMMFRGTSRIKDSEFNRIISEQGADSNAFTGYDFTAYHQSLDISKLELAMFLEADRMENLKIDESVFPIERDVVFQERRQVVDNNPAGEFVEAFRRNLWGEDRYARPIIGSLEEIQKLTSDDIKKFYKKYYAPNNAILVLSGDIDVETAKILAEKYYGKIKNKKLAEASSSLSLNNKFSSSLTMQLPNINTPRVMKTYIMPSYKEDKKKAFALSVLSKYLGDGETSKLHKKMVLDRKNALSVSTSYNPYVRGKAAFSFSAMPKPEVDLDKFMRDFDKAVIDAIREINVENIKIVKEKMLAGLVYLKDNPLDAGYVVGSMAAVGLSLEDVEAWAEEIGAVTYEDVARVAKEMLENASSQIGILMPKGE